MTTTATPLHPPTDPATALARARVLVPHLAARAQQHDATGEFPHADLADLRAHGLLGLMTPTRLGGCGATFADYADVALELGTGAGATALIFNMHASVTGALAHTPDDLLRQLDVPDHFLTTRDRLLAHAARGALYAVAMSERGTGARLSRVTTTYRPHDGGYHIRGSKTFVSAAGHAHAYLVAARDATSTEPKISYFLVPHDAGVRVEPTWDSLGMRATCSHDLHLDAHVAPDALLGGIEGLALPLAQVMPQWLVASYAAVYVGVARAALHAARDHLHARALHTLPAVRARIGRADAAIAAARLAVTEAARRVTHHPGEPDTNRWIWRAKLLAGDTAHTVASSLLEAAGASATRRGHPLERLYRDARCGALQPATSDVCADWLGVATLGGNPEQDTEVARW
ncbi:Acyl-CoA dehydrogenase [Streptoalloteichus tenebrarius]|uniref:Dibenzothiophene monooxygenase n=1 Tax=Streptoalloteichus tenebrarius (strain ATCC 17920 / DSM 40477 / JCM 4838 / CBS 697.72 / NBRC 16177 / NCIMB 11028 / NRRL B-12390 / A12253. 1 / ISP 5477) TaxID=1933 RepID=A0ABT1HNM0_STRSD|nr:acyl-CoA dehydrogenase family protein [Streptoalloteichus tenebrarius]MCP2257098.1 Acyl-CoA dehydrogenase [Streptoalloteichus tenebrarius]BFE98729.1 acyl-CoA dehydrogenase family protein [Streptoalloteichus tenebrarius]